MASPSIPHATQLDFLFPEPEVWRAVPGWEGLYEVSNLGRARSLNRPGRPGVGHQPRKGRVMKSTSVGPSRSSDHYQVIWLKSNGKRKQCFLHRLVLEAFVGSAPEGWCCNHKDGDKENNALSNLEWCTPLENILHARRTGLRFDIGEDHPYAILTNKQVLSMRRMYKEGMTQTVLAEKFGTSLSTVHAIIKRRNWKHLPEE